MELAKEDPNGIEVEVPIEGGTRKMRVSTGAGEKRAKMFNDILEHHIYDHDLEDESGKKLDPAAVWALVIANVEIDNACIEAWEAALPLPPGSVRKPAS